MSDKSQDSNSSSDDSDDDDNAAKRKKKRRNKSDLMASLNTSKENKGKTNIMVDNLIDQADKDIINDKKRKNIRNLIIKQSSTDDFEFLEEEIEHINLSQKGIFRLNDPRMTRWDLFIIILAFYNCYSIPF